MMNQRMPTCYCGTGVLVQYMYYLIKLPDAAWLRTLSLYASSLFAGVRVGWSLSSSKYSSDKRDREKMHQFTSCK